MAKKSGAPEKPEGTAVAIEKAAARVDKRVVAGVAGIAIGSAAIVAGLMFTSRAAKAKLGQPEPKLPNRPHAPELFED